MNLVIVSCLGVIKEEESFVRMFEQVFRDLNIESLCVVECCQSSLQLCVSLSGHDLPHVHPCDRSGQWPLLRGPGVGPDHNLTLASSITLPRLPD